MIDYPGLRFGEARHDVTPKSWDERETLWRSRAWSVLTRTELRALLDDRHMLVKAASDAQVEADVLRGRVEELEAQRNQHQSKWEAAT